MEQKKKNKSLWEEFNVIFKMESVFYQIQFPPCPIEEILSGLLF